MPRTIFLGDVHGCGDELQDLFDKVCLLDDDKIVAVGDLIVRGPKPTTTLALLRFLGAVSVRGNHEDRILRWHDDGSRRTHLGDMVLETASALSEADFRMMRSFPLWIDLPAHGVRVVHAGVVPGEPIEKTDPAVLMSIRCVSKDGRPSTKRGKWPWGAAYTGPPHVVFGHNAAPDPQIHPWATCIDTGCVYGGRLTAMVLAAGQHPPPPDQRGDVLVSVPARKAYVKI